MFTCYCSGGICVRTTRPMSDGGLPVVPVQFLGPVKMPIVLSVPVGDGPKARNVYGIFATCCLRTAGLPVPSTGCAAVQ